MTDGERDIINENERDARECEESMSNSVWLVETGGCMDGDHDIEGIFWTREKAEEFVGTFLSEYRRTVATITEYALDDRI